METFAAIANLGGLGAFSAIVYFELRHIRQTLEVLAGKVVTIEIEEEE